MREDKAVCFWFDQFYGGLTNYAMRVVTEIIVDSEAGALWWGQNDTTSTCHRRLLAAALPGGAARAAVGKLMRDGTAEVIEAHYSRSN
jgi:hypothetical protein